MLKTRIVILEAALACIDRECERALDRPDTLFITMCRVAAVARQALDGPAMCLHPENTVKAASTTS